MSTGAANKSADNHAGRWSTGLTPKALTDLVGLARAMKPDITEDDPVLIGEGISTLAYGLQAPGGGWVLRVSRDHPLPWTWRGGRAREVELLAGLRQRGVQVPAEAVVIEQVDGLPTAILERRVTGTPLTPELVRTDPSMTIKIAALLDQLHTYDLDDPLGRAIPRNDPVDGFRQALTTVDLGDDGLRQRVEAALEVLEAREGIRTLCHRDFRCDHLLVGEDGEIAGLIDLGDVGVDDPAIDLAFLNGDLGPHTGAAICAAMNTADDGLHMASELLRRLWPLLELAPGGEAWGDPSTAHARLTALLSTKPPR